MADPYGDKPHEWSEADQWHELRFQISIDKPVDWSEVDLRKWAHTVARYTALVMNRSTLDGEDPDPDEVIKTLIMKTSASRISFVTDEGLFNMIDEFEE